ncbi:phosphoribosylaminoimidazole-succinocarboxamide synthase [Alteribacillus persepolensis]|uniref:Phosphoribosylaminoimidazole-succinocarboxamide synthase n=1 Tax=Alteribacillus persepolensis TaxID=568899 RepID=A0A1G8F6L0_9BACI|nr:phosphoribosylaminoimidazolesuccinocarboxamide synthase [Alteribacillus persepolensis]SDH77756.1 phosphoribosylaminoimidazole-succinocarboxamide synthase [Alteribacillus persepolensis]
MQKEKLLYEGKAKKLYKTDEPRVLWVEYKDDATAFNGEKKEVITGKGQLNNEISSLLFQKLEDSGINSHFLKKLSSTEQLVQETEIIPLEVVVRNIVAGSLQKRTGLKEGTVLDQAIVEFYYKDDELGDPLINNDHIRILKAAQPQEVEQLKKQALAVNETLKEHFDSCGLLLVDFKLEFGRTADKQVLLADEISPDTCRLWDKATKEKFDKDVFRFGLGSLEEGYTEILKRLGGAVHG